MLNVVPATPVTSMSSSSIRMRNCGSDGKRAALATWTVVEAGEIPPPLATVV